MTEDAPNAISDHLVRADRKRKLLLFPLDSFLLLGETLLEPGLAKSEVFSQEGSGIETHGRRSALVESSNRFHDRQRHPAHRSQHSSEGAEPIAQERPQPREIRRKSKFLEICNKNRE